MAAQQHYARLLNKKSSDVANPQWEDLGWAWGKLLSLFIPNEILGKRSAPDHAYNFVASKRNPDWHDLGWTWGRRK